MLFFQFFLGYTIESILGWKKPCPCFLDRMPETYSQQKLHSLKTSIPKMKLTFQSRLLALKRSRKSLKQKKLQRSESFFFGLLQFPSNFYKD